MTSQFADPYSAKLRKAQPAIVFAASQFQGDRQSQEDYFINFNDECIALADGVGGMPHGDVAAGLACETAIWGYKQIRLRRTYWLDKRGLVRRIFRSTNIAVCQKQREEGYTNGMATTLTVAIIGDRSVWLGSVGDSPAFLLHDNSLVRLTKDDVDAEGQLTKAIGVARYGLAPQFKVVHFTQGDALLIVTDGVSSAVSPDEMKNIVLESGTTGQSLTEGVISLLNTAKNNGSGDNMTACLIKRVRLTQT